MYELIVNDRKKTAQILKNGDNRSVIEYINCLNNMKSFPNINKLY